MEKESLEKLLSTGMSTYAMASAMGISQTNIRYWLRKFGLNTKGCTLDRCKECGSKIKGRKRHYCSKECSESARQDKTRVYTTNANNYLRQKRVGLERKKELVDSMGGKCSSCGYSKNLAALVFHHKDPKNKTFCLDIRKLSNTRWGSILEESRKCILLCHNCHMELHYPDLNKT